ncbi:DUF433 domain-containing protein [Aquimarina sp. ERC-38]|uniref:DUF433 domain-containing protein n=1 Tax=Aquimarina sp. ERC-38 TaxID=2949996 RepID=UPI002247FC62|nr:DUF433 domain-containing protein [Aquimarina sp. ERC-38]UZO81009.1 DUF433 domain-containing protein [Aquimarina sp. ERC-38]
MEYLSDRITLDADLCNGRPTIRSLRITVETILDFISNGDSVEEVLESYPFLEREDIAVCFSFATKIIKRI